MTHSVNTLQQKLEERAAKQAEGEIKAAISALPYFDSLTFRRNNSEPLIVQNYELLEKLKSAMEARRRAEILETLTRELLDTVNRIDELANGLELDRQ